jgi:hypothetical protein
MLLNVTNHPSAMWAEDQKNAACQLWHSIEDMAFPAVDPKASLEEVQELAQEYCARILATDCTAVLLQGEFTFTVQLALLLAPHVNVYTACSDRNTVLNADGTKTVAFKFEQFRLLL